jgi:hypothetical protein
MGYVASTREVVMNDKLKKELREAVVAHFRVIFQNFPGRTAAIGLKHRSLPSDSNSDVPNMK